MNDCSTSLLYQAMPQYVIYDDAALFSDLHIDQIMSAVTDGLEPFRLDEYYCQRPTARADVEFRMEIVRALHEASIRECIDTFLTHFSVVRQDMRIAEGIHDAPMRQKWLLDAAVAYVEAVEVLLQCGNSASDGLSRFLMWLRDYAGADAFVCFRDATAAMKGALDAIHYSVKLDVVNGIAYYGEDTETGDVCDHLLHTFARYDLSDTKDNIIAYADIHMNELERRFFQILQAEHADVLKALSAYALRFDGFVHEKLIAFEREVLFFTSYLRYVKRMEEMGFGFSIPHLTCAGLHICGGYDASLALIKLDAAQVVENDFDILSGEHSFLLTGPNQGGKTTFSRMLGQILYFASLGLPVPCREAEICFMNGLITHFTVQEDPGSRSGRLQEELLRLNRILERAPAQSFVILNELFSSTTTHDALDMGERILKLFKARGCICLYVTHLSSLTGGGEAVHLVAETTDDDPPVRTFRIARSTGAGLACANALLKKYRLHAAGIEERIYATVST